MAERNEGAPPEKRIELRISINLGDVIAEEHDGKAFYSQICISTQLDTNELTILLGLPHSLADFLRYRLAG